MNFPGNEQRAKSKATRIANGRLQITPQEATRRLKRKISYNDVLKSIKKRDKSDYNRKYSPLKKTKDSILINTTNLTKKACFLKIKKIMDKKIYKI